MKCAAHNFALIAPYVIWMALMALLPRTAAAYAWRGGATLAALVFSVFVFGLPRFGFRRCLVGAAVGFVVLAVWLAPGSLLAVESSSPYDPAVCGWALTIAKLLASAFVISVAEELFFRKWLINFAGFGWSVVLFALEHGRWDSGIAAGIVFVAEGAFAGIAYGWLARRFGLLAAIVAHATTNLLLGLWIILRGQWQFW